MSHFKAEVHELHVLRQGVAPLENPPQAGTPLDIVVSDALARYWIVERPAGLASAAELDLLAAERFAAIFGDDPAEWALRIDPLPQAERWLACAIPNLFATDLAQAAAVRGWRVRHVQTFFIREFNRHCRALDGDTAFCVASHDSTTIALIAEGVWRGIRVHPPLDRSVANFGALLRRDCRQAGMASDGLLPVVVGSLREAAR